MRRRYYRLQIIDNRLERVYIITGKSGGGQIFRLFCFYKNKIILFCCDLIFELVDGFDELFAESDGVALRAEDYAIECVGDDEYW